MILHRVFCMIEKVMLVDGKHFLLTYTKALPEMGSVNLYYYRRKSTGKKLYDMEKEDLRIY